VLVYFSYFCKYSYNIRRSQIFFKKPSAEQNNFVCFFIPRRILYFTNSVKFRDYHQIIWIFFFKLQTYEKKTFINHDSGFGSYMPAMRRPE